MSNDSDSFFRPGTTANGMVPLKQAGGISSIVVALRAHWMFVAIIGLAVWFLFLRKR